MAEGENSDFDDDIRDILENISEECGNEFSHAFATCLRELGYSRIRSLMFFTDLEKFKSSGFKDHFKEGQLAELFVFICQKLNYDISNANGSQCNTNESRLNETLHTSAVLSRLNRSRSTSKPNHSRNSLHSSISRSRSLAKCESQFPSAVRVHQRQSSQIRAEKSSFPLSDVVQQENSFEFAAFETNSPLMTSSPLCKSRKQQRSESSDTGKRDSVDRLDIEIHGMASLRFGIAQLKEFQTGAIKAILGGNNVVIVEQTGSGKSIPLFLPSLLTKKTSVVIVPTVALIEAHYATLAQKNVKVEIWGGGKTVEENRETEDKVRKGQVQVLLLTPEFLYYGDSEARIGVLEELAQGDLLQMIALDECHCAISWASFRQKYNSLTELKTRFAKVPVMLVTATARQSAVEALVRMYCSSDLQTEFFIGTVDRPNVRLHTKHLRLCLDGRQYSSDFWDEKIVGDIIAEIGSEKAIVYIDDKGAVSEIANCFRKTHGVRTREVTGGAQMRSKNKEAVDAWLRGDVQVVVATSAFGMGVSRGDIRHIYRIGYPSNLEEFVQEAGRAGRNGDEASATLIVPSDVSCLKLFLRGANAEEEKQSASSQFHDIWKFANSKSCLRASLIETFENKEASRTCLQLGGSLCSNCHSSAELADYSSEVRAALSALSDLKDYKLGREKTAAYIMGSSSLVLSNFRKGRNFGIGNSFKRSKDWWVALLEILAVESLIDVSYYIANTPSLIAYYRQSISEKGRAFLEQNDSVFLTKVMQTTARPRRLGSVPSLLKELLADRELWSDYEIPTGQQATDLHPVTELRYPGFFRNSQHSEKLFFISDHRKLPFAKNSVDAQWILNDVQVGKGNKNVRNLAVKIDGAEETTVKYKAVDCEGLKMCSFCEVCFSLNAKLNKCKIHKGEPLVRTQSRFGACCVSFIFVWSVEQDDHRCWLYSYSSSRQSVEVEKCGLNLHNHPLPLNTLSSGETFALDVKCPSQIKENIISAALKNSRLTTKQLSQGVGQEFPPVLATNACSTTVISKLKQHAVKSVVGTGSLKDFLVSFDEQQQEQLILQSTKANAGVRGEFAKILTKPFIRKFQINGEEDDFVLTMTPMQSLLFACSDFIEMDFTYNENTDLPKMLHFCTYSHLIDKYVSLAKFRTKSEKVETYLLALNELNKSINADLEEYGLADMDWSSLSSILVDWSATQHKALQLFLGDELAGELIKGCRVHWARSWLRASKRFTDSTSSEKTFVKICKIIGDSSNSEAIAAAFRVLGGIEQISCLANFAEFSGVRDANFIVLGNAQNWVKWWMKEERLKALSTAFWDSETEIWQFGPRDTNAMESINRQEKRADRVREGLKRALLECFSGQKKVVLDHINALMNEQVTENHSAHEKRILGALRQRANRKRRMHDRSLGFESDTDILFSKTAPKKMVKVLNGKQLEQKENSTPVQKSRQLRNRLNYSSTSPQTCAAKNCRKEFCNVLGSLVECANCGQNFHKACVDVQAKTRSLHKCNQHKGK